MSYFTTVETFFVVPLDHSDGEIQKIDSLLAVLEESGVGKLIEETEFKSSGIGRKSYNPYRLFAAILYCFAMHKGTLRNMEEMCRYDLRLWYILGQECPSYKTIQEFINCVILPYRYLIFTKITSAIFRKLKADISCQYLDGTKIEANANKYRFVLKPGKHRTNLNEKITELIKKMDVHQEIDEEKITPVYLKCVLREFETVHHMDPENFPKGRGHHLTEEQRLLKTGYDCLEKLLEYDERELICGPGRSSYYRSDHDATAMALKTDYYSGHGSNLHAAYNIQFLVSSGFVTFYGVFQDRTDYHTLIPLLENYELYYGSYPENICADSGYGIYENYEYLNRHNIKNYIKFLNWNGESSGKNPQKFFLNSKENGFVCLNGNPGKEIPFDNTFHQKRKHTKLYLFEGCLNCPYEYKCREKIKDRNTNTRKYELNLKEEKYHRQARTNLLSIRGIEIRINRSIQSEGDFGQLKQNMGYVRLRRRGMEKVSCEIMLMCMAINIRKLFSNYGKENIRSSFWEPDTPIDEEHFPEVKQKKKG